MSGPAATSSAGRWLTRANALTALRLGCAPLLAAAVLRDAPVPACVLFVLAVATDLLDGPVARRFKESSPLGGLLDHATDATFVAIGLAALSQRGEVPAVLAPLVVLAFVQYTLDSRAMAGRPLRASFLGRWNGIAYFVLLGVPVVRDAVGLSWPPTALVRSFGWLLVASSLLSVTDRLWALRRSGRP